MHLCYFLQLGMSWLLLHIAVRDNAISQAKQLLYRRSIDTHSWQPSFQTILFKAANSPFQRNSMSDQLRNIDLIAEKGLAGRELSMT